MRPLLLLCVSAVALATLPAYGADLGSGPAVHRAVTKAVKVRPAVPAVVAVPVRTVCDQVADGSYVFRSGSMETGDVYEIPTPGLDKGLDRRPNISPFKGYVPEYPAGRPEPRPMPRLLCGAATAIDGNTLRLGRHTFRLFGIEAPSPGETCPNTTGSRWACGDAARIELMRRTAGRLTVCEAVDQEGDDIMSARCEIDGRDLQAGMIRDGFAAARYADTPTYVQREGQAVRAGRGIWEAYRPSSDNGFTSGADRVPHGAPR